MRVTVAGLLFVGKAASIARLLPQAEVIYLHYSDEAQTEYDNRMDMQEPVISILDKLTERIRTYNRLTNVQVGLFRLEVYDFSEAVFQEALLNALAHRSSCKMSCLIKFIVIWQICFRHKTKHFSIAHSGSHIIKLSVVFEWKSHKHDAIQCKGKRSDLKERLSCFTQHFFL